MTAISPIEVNMAPERQAELDRLKAMMVEANKPFVQQQKIISNLEQQHGVPQPQPIYQPIVKKASGGALTQAPLVQLSETDPFLGPVGGPGSAPNTTATQEDFNNAVNNVNSVLSVISQMSIGNMISNVLGLNSVPSPSQDPSLTEEENNAAVAAAIASDNSPDNTASNAVNGLDSSSDATAAAAAAASNGPGDSGSNGPSGGVSGPSGDSSGSPGGEAHGGSIHARHNTRDIDAMRLALMKGGTLKAKEPKNTVKAYKLFRVHKDHPGKLFPLFVDANTPVEMGKWINAKEGEMRNGKVKSKIGDLAYRPGWHAGDLPIATHIGEKSDPSLTAPDTRPANHAWAEVEMPNDVDWQSIANERGTNAQGKLIPVKAHITDQIPMGGHYRYKTNPNMTGNWLIGGSMKVNRVLTDKEVEKINKEAGLSDLPRAQPFKKKNYGFARGGLIAPEEWIAEEHVHHKPNSKVTHAHHLEIEERPL